MNLTRIFVFSQLCAVASAPAPPAPCGDDPDWRKWNKPNRGCRYVAGKPERRCKWPGANGILAWDACRETCGSCVLATNGPTAAPTTDRPTAAPSTHGPTAAPTTAGPTSAPATAPPTAAPAGSPTKSPTYPPWPTNYRDKGEDPAAESPTHSPSLPPTDSTQFPTLTPTDDGPVTFVEWFHTWPSPNWSVGTAEYNDGEGETSPTPDPDRDFPVWERVPMRHMKTPDLSREDGGIIQANLTLHVNKEWGENGAAYGYIVYFLATDFDNDTNSISDALTWRADDREVLGFALGKTSGWHRFCVRDHEAVTWEYLHNSSSRADSVGAGIIAMVQFKNDNGCRLDPPRQCKRSNQRECCLAGNNLPRKVAMSFCGRYNCDIDDC